MTNQINFRYKRIALNGNLENVIEQINNAPLNSGWELVTIVKETDHPHMWTAIFKCERNEAHSS